MDLKHFVKAAEARAEQTLKDVPELYREELRPEEHLKEAGQRFVDKERSRLDEELDLSPIASRMVEKIAEEVTQLTLQARLTAPQDEHYKFLMKSAGVEVPDSPVEEVTRVLETIQELEKVAAGGEVAAAKSLMKEVAPGLLRWGTLGRWGTAALVPTGVGAYLYGKHKGRGVGQQELADALAARLAPKG